MKKYGLFIPKGGDKKKMTLDFVIKNESKFVMSYNKKGNPQPWCYDMADSFCVVKAGCSIWNVKKK